MHMECTFESLPFLFPKSQRASLLAWQQAAVECERRQAIKRQEQLQQLQHHITKHLHCHPNKVSSWKQNVAEPTDVSTISKRPPLSLPPQCPPPCPPPQCPPPSLPPQSTIKKEPPRSPRPPRSVSKGDVYTKLTALARGFLTRRLLQSNKIISLINTIKDGGMVLAGITEPVSQQDKALRDRVHTQLQVARMTLLEILHLPVGERMTYIAHSHLVRRQREQRETNVCGSVRYANGGHGKGRLSTATQRAIERRQKSSPTSLKSSPTSLKTTQTRLLTAQTRLIQDKVETTNVLKDSSCGNTSRTSRLRPIGQGIKTIQTPSRSVAVQVKLKIQKGPKMAAGNHMSGQDSKSRQVKSGQVKSGQVTSGQAKLKQTTSGQPGQNKSGRQRTRLTTDKRKQLITPSKISSKITTKQH